MEILENSTYFWSLIGVSLIVLSLWLYRRVHHNTADNELFDDTYYDSDPLLDDEVKPVENTVHPSGEPVENIVESNDEPVNPDEKLEIKTDTDEKLEENEKKLTKQSRPEPELIVALFVLPNHEEGFLGTDIFTVLQDQNMSYGKMEIFHHYGVGEIKVKHSIFSVANILNPGTFNPKEMDTFRSAGLVFFMQLPGAFGGRVAFELMLNTAKRVAESLEGTLTDERQYILDQEMIEGFREKITQFELEKEQND